MTARGVVPAIPREQLLHRDLVGVAEPERPAPRQDPDRARPGMRAANHVAAGRRLIVLRQAGDGLYELGQTFREPRRLPREEIAGDVMRQLVRYRLRIRLETCHRQHDERLGQAGDLEIARYVANGQHLVELRWAAERDDAQAPGDLQLLPYQCLQLERVHLLERPDQHLGWLAPEIRVQQKMLGAVLPPFGAAEDQFICFAEPFFREASISSSTFRWT